MKTIDDIALEAVNKIGEVNCSQQKFQIKAQYQCLIIDAIEKAQALLSQGEPTVSKMEIVEPVGYLRFKTINDVTFVPRDVRFVLHGASPHITTYPDLPLYLAQPSIEALQKDKAELIEYAEMLKGSLNTLAFSVARNEGEETYL